MPDQWRILGLHVREHTNEGSCRQKMGLIRNAIFAFLALALPLPEGPNASSRVSHTVAAIPIQATSPVAGASTHNIFDKAVVSSVAQVNSRAKTPSKPRRKRPPTRKPTRRPARRPVRRTPAPTVRPTKRPNRRRPSKRPTSSPTFKTAPDVIPPTLPPIKVLLQKGISMVLDGAIILDNISINAWKRATANRIANETLTEIPGVINLTVVIDLRNQMTLVRRLSSADASQDRKLLSGVVITFDVTISFVSNSSLTITPNVIVNEAFGTTTKRGIYVSELHAANTTSLNGVSAVGVFVPLPTPSPTVSPTAHPTPPPTRQPSQEPTFQPTKPPTLRPTGAPTPVPLRSTTLKAATMVLGNGVLLDSASLDALISAIENQIRIEISAAMPNATNVTVTVNVTNQNAVVNLRRSLDAMPSKGSGRRRLLTGLVLTFDTTFYYIIRDPTQIVETDTIVDDAFGPSLQRKQFIEALHATNLTELAGVSGVGVIISLPTPSPTSNPTTPPTPLPTRAPSPPPTRFPTELPTVPPTGAPTPALFKTLTERGVSMVLYGGLPLNGSSLLDWQSAVANQVAKEIALDMPNATGVNVTASLAQQTSTSNLRRTLLEDIEQHRKLLPGLLILFDVSTTFKIVASLPIIELGTIVKKAFETEDKKSEFISALNASNTTELAGVYDVSVSVAPPTPSPTSSPTTHPSAFPTQRPSLPPTLIPTKPPTLLPTAGPTPVPLLSLTLKGVRMVLFGGTNLTGSSLTAWQNATANQITNETAIEMPEAANIKVIVTLTNQATSVRRTLRVFDLLVHGRQLIASDEIITFDVIATLNLIPLVPPADLATVVKNAFETVDQKGQFVAELLASNTSELAGVYDVSVSVPPPTPSPTPSPTTRPTPSLPTPLPTPGPTLSEPTKSPSGKPTTFPTFLPTLPPTGLPTASPTGKPTLIPTAKPTISTAMPSRSQHPSEHPSHHPSKRPV